MRLIEVDQCSGQLLPNGASQSLTCCCRILANRKFVAICRGSPYLLDLNKSASAFQLDDIVSIMHQFDGRFPANRPFI